MLPTIVVDTLADIAREREFAGAPRRDHPHSIWSSVVRDKTGRVKKFCKPHLNLRTNAGADWQARVMEGDSATLLTGTATASSATSLTTSGLTASAYVDHLVIATPNSAGTGSTVYGVITANSTTVITVDRWYNPASPGGSAGTTPNATAGFIIVPGSAPAVYLALTANTFSPSATDTTLAGELTTNGFSRAYYTTLTHTGGSTSYSIAHTFTATGTETINNEGVFTAAGPPTQGTMVFEAAEPNPPTLVSGDTLAQTVSVSY